MKREKRDQKDREANHPALPVIGRGVGASGVRNGPDRWGGSEDSDISSSEPHGPPHANERGFTLIEIMVVITILAILSVLVVPKLVGRTDEARRVAAKVQIKNIEQALQMYKLDSGVYPSTEQGLDALVRKPSVGQAPKNWREGGYLPKVPPDPWGNPFVYASPGSHGDYDLVSQGSDGEGGGEGKDADIENWNME